MPNEKPPLEKWKVLPLVAVIVVAAGVCRLYAAGGDFWLDEIQTWFMIFQFHKVDALWKILLIQQENNHFINTAMLYFMGPDASTFSYRLPSVGAGVGSVVMAGLIARQRGKLEAVTAMLLIGGSYPLVHYSSEARGYSYAVFFALVSYYLAEKSLRSKRWGWGFSFAVSAILGVISQLLFVYCYATLAIWGLWRMWQDRMRWWEIVFKTLRWHLIPVAFMTWIYFTTIRHMIGDSGPIYSLMDVVVSSLSLTVGGPYSGPWAVVAAVFVSIAIVVSLRWLWRDQMDASLFFAAVGLVAPIVFILALERKEVYPRYFLISMVFLLLLLSHFLARLWERPRFGKTAYCLLLAAFLWGNGVHTGRLIRTGRGSYSKAILLMQQQTPFPRITVGSDHEFRNGFVVEFYRHRLPLKKPLVYFPDKQWPPQGPQWLLRHNQEIDYEASKRCQDGVGNSYRLVRQFPYAGLSGFHWALYENSQVGR